MERGRLSLVRHRSYVREGRLIQTCQLRGHYLDRRHSLERGCLIDHLRYIQSNSQNVCQ